MMGVLMQISRDVGLPIVEAFESCLAPVAGKPGLFKPYYCPAGVLTQGYGHTNLGGIPPKVVIGTLWDKAQCDQALANDMAVFEKHVADLAPNVTDQGQFDALVSWSFNTGGPADSSVWSYARKGDVEGTVERLKRWNKGAGQRSVGRIEGPDKAARCGSGAVRRRSRRGPAHRRDAPGRFLPAAAAATTPAPAGLRDRQARRAGDRRRGSGRRSRHDQQDRTAPTRRAWQRGSLPRKRGRAGRGRHLLHLRRAGRRRRRLPHQQDRQDSRRLGLTWRTTMSLATLLTLLALAIVGVLIVDFVRSYVAATSSGWQRLWDAGRGSATMVV